MHLGVKKQQQNDIWIKNKLINPDNYAFLKGKSTAMPILITKAVLEDSKFTGKEVHTLQVPYPIKEISLRRMGVPEEGISLWCAYDHIREMEVITPGGHTEQYIPRVEPLPKVRRNPAWA
jgi:hypothetical protein